MSTDKRLIDLDVQELREIITEIVNTPRADQGLKNNLISRTKAAKYIGCHANTIDALSKQGRLDFVRYGKQRRFKISDLDKFINLNTRKA